MIRIKPQSIINIRKTEKIKKETDGGNHRFPL